jgi:hypothetical protein
MGFASTWTERTIKVGHERACRAIQRGGECGHGGGEHARNHQSDQPARQEVGDKEAEDFIVLGSGRQVKDALRIQHIEPDAKEQEEQELEEDDQPA